MVSTYNTFEHFLSAIEEVLKTTINNCFPRDWNEDFITRSIAIELPKKFSNNRIHNLERPFWVKFDSFKLDGEPEEMHGDLAILVNLTTWEEEKIEGVAFIEAKRRKRDSTQFPAIRLPQLKKILEETPHSYTMLYDYQDITGFSDNLLFRSPVFYEPFLFSLLNKTFYPISTQSLLVPTGEVVALGKKSTRLYKLGIPFSIQLTARFLRGFELDYTKAAINTAKGFIQDKGGPKYILVAGVSADGNEPSVNIGLNQDQYRRLE